MTSGGLPPGVVPFVTPAEIDAAIPLAVSHLRGAGVLGHPTETVYGLGCLLGDDALQALQHTKGRGEDKPFVVLVGAREHLHELGIALHGSARVLADRFWPGPLTLVVRSDRALAPQVQNADGGVAVRWTSHEAVQRLLLVLGAPMTSTSANAPGLPPCMAAAEIVAQWPDAVANRSLLVLDAGHVATGAAPSTIVDCMAPVPRVVRRGAIAPTTLRVTLPGLAGEE